ncbi:hypothetical protein X741_33820 [Mesorhizobium sp. LNHC229A00]|nr:hypothetical protein X741_33820 [Mesorhizobium sp. LNHC229A00]
METSRQPIIDTSHQVTMEMSRPRWLLLLLLLTMRR